MENDTDSAIYNGGLVNEIRVSAVRRSRERDNMLAVRRSHNEIGSVVLSE